MLHDPLKLCEAVHDSETFFDRVLGAMNHKNDVVRCKASEILFMATKPLYGRQMMKTTLVPDVLAKISDQPVQNFVFQTLINLTQQKEFVEQNLSLLNTISSMVPDLMRNDFRLATLALKIIKNMLINGARKQMLKINGLQMLADVVELQIGGNVLRQTAAECIRELCVAINDRELNVSTAAKKVHLVDLLVKNMKQEHFMEARRAFVGALMSLSLETDSKMDIVQKQGAVVLCEMLKKEKDELMLLFVIKAIACLGEDHNARYFFNENSINDLQKHEKSQDFNISKAAKEAIDVVSWYP